MGAIALFRVENPNENDDLLIRKIVTAALRQDDADSGEIERQCAAPPLPSP